MQNRFIFFKDEANYIPSEIWNSLVPKVKEGEEPISLMFPTGGDLDINWIEFETFFIILKMKENKNPVITIPIKWMDFEMFKEEMFFKELAEIIWWRYPQILHGYKLTEEQYKEEESALRERRRVETKE